jgi:hypothetical protein
MKKRYFQASCVSGKRQFTTTTYNKWDLGKAEELSRVAPSAACAISGHRSTRAGCKGPPAITASGAAPKGAGESAADGAAAHSLR